MPSANHRTRLDRIALAIGEQRLDLGLSQRDLAELSGVSASSIYKLERGGRISPELIVRLAATLATIELHTAAPSTWPQPVELEVAS